MLRQPLEDGEVTIARVTATLNYPAKFMLVAAMNPCPCGYWGDAGGRCNCSSGDIRRYLKKISGPLLDRIDININVPRLAYGEIAGEAVADLARRGGYFRRGCPFAEQCEGKCF